MITLTLDDCRELGCDDLDGIVAAELLIGANPACTRHLNGAGVPCVLYLRTASGVLGTGAHPGYVIECDPDWLEARGVDDAEIWIKGLGCNSADIVEHDGSGLCLDCWLVWPSAHLGRRAREILVCDSCRQGLQESMAYAAQDAEVAP